MSGKFKIFQGQGTVREFHNLSRKIEFLLKCQGDVREVQNFKWSLDFQIKKQKEEKYWKWLGQFSWLFGSCWTILTASKFFCLKENWRVWRPLSPQLPFVLRWWNVFVKHKIFPDYRNQSYCLIVNNNLGEKMFCRSPIVFVREIWICVREMSGNFVFSLLYEPC